MLLLKNPQFLPNDYETRSKLSTHEFHNYWVKIVAFLIKAYVVCTMKVLIGVPRSVRFEQNNLTEKNYVLMST